MVGEIEEAGQLSDGRVVRAGTVHELTESAMVRLEDVFVDAVGGVASDARGSLAWLGQS